MRCLSVRLQQFRAHADRTFAFAPGLTLLYGPNGAGKTNVLEALHYLALTKSFLASSDGYVIRRGARGAELQGAFEGERRGAFSVRMLLGGETGKAVTYGGTPLATLAEHIGRVPVVLMAPQDYVLTAEGPEERRRFLNNLLSQARPVYLDDLVRFNRALKQRNDLLSRARGRRGSLPDELLDAWTEEVATLGARIVAARRAALSDFSGYLDQAYDLLEARVERPALRYDGAGDGDTAEAVAEDLRGRFRKAYGRERELGRTLVGPHRDEIVFSLGDFEVRRYASQGQHRTFGVALRLAQYLYLRELAGEPPLLLLDDLFGTLDAARTLLLLDLFTGDQMGQVIVTHPDRGDVSAFVRFDGLHHTAFDVREPPNVQKEDHEPNDASLDQERADPSDS